MRLGALRGGRELHIDDLDDDVDESSGTMYNVDQSTIDRGPLVDRPLTRNAWPRMSTPRIAQTRLLVVATRWG